MRSYQEDRLERGQEGQSELLQNAVFGEIRRLPPRVEQMTRIANAEPALLLPGRSPSDL